MRISRALPSSNQSPFVVFLYINIYILYFSFRSGLPRVYRWNTYTWAPLSRQFQTIGGYDRRFHCIIVLRTTCIVLFGCPHLLVSFFLYPIYCPPPRRHFGSHTRTNSRAPLTDSHLFVKRAREHCRVTRAIVKTPFTRAAYAVDVSSRNRFYCHIYTHNTAIVTANIRYLQLNRYHA